MRALKKTLCLVLTVVMVLGLCTFGVNAQMTTKDYSDADKITNTQAVDILGTIGVLEGDDDGFRPGDTLKRSEGAKIITTMMNVNVPSNATSKFTDAQGHWAEAYIAYCTEQGIIDGMTETTFEPESKLTGAQFAKMLLCALGYDAEIEGLTGSAWILNVASLIKTAKLDADLDAIPYETAVTRDEAAQMAFNALIAPLVTYNASTNVIVNGIPVTINAGNAIYMTTAVRDTQTISSAQVNDGSARGTYIVEFAEYYQPKLVRDTHAEDDYGRPATTWLYDRLQVGKPYPNESMQVLYTTKKVDAPVVYKAIGAEISRRLGDNLGANDVTTEVYIDGVYYAKKDYSKDLEADIKAINDNKGKLTAISGEGVQLEVYVDDDTYDQTNENTYRTTIVTIVVVHTYLAEITAVSNNGDAKITVIDDNTDEIIGTVVDAKKSALPELGDYEEGDMVLVNVLRDDAKPGNPPKSITKIMTPGIKVDEYVSAYTVDSDTSRMSSITTEAGKEDKIAAQAHWNEKILEKYTLEELRGYTYDVYYDQYGNVIGIDYNKKDSSFVFIVGVENTSSYLSSGKCDVKAIWTDGTMETLTVRLSTSDTSSAKPYINEVIEHRNTGAGSGSAVVNRWFTASKDDNGSITLVDVVGLNEKLNKAGDYGQWAYTLVPGGDGKTDIGLTQATLNADGGKYAYGNDASIYITAEVKDESEGGVKGGAIDKVTGVTTGIKNTNIAALKIDAEKYENFEADKDDKTSDGEDGNNVYYIYDANTHYVIAAVVVSESAGGTLVYITSNPTSRGYVSGVGYVDTYEVIMNGQKTTIDVNSNKTDTSTGNKLEIKTMYLVGFDDDGYVVSQRRAEMKPDKLDTPNNKSRGYAWNNETTDETKDKYVTLDKNTLYIGDPKTTDNWIVIDSNAKFYIAENKTAKNNMSYKDYNRALSAYNAATADGAYISAVYAECDKGTGMATTVIFLYTKTVNISSVTKPDVELDVYDSADNAWDATKKTLETTVGETVYLDTFLNNEEKLGTVTYKWTQGKRTLGTDANYSWTPTKADTYEITITVTNTVEGKTATWTETVTIKVGTAPITGQGKVVFADALKSDFAILGTPIFRVADNGEATIIFRFSNPEYVSGATVGKTGIPTFKYQIKQGSSVLVPDTVATDGANDALYGTNSTTGSSYTLGSTDKTALTPYLLGTAAEDLTLEITEVKYDNYDIKVVDVDAGKTYTPTSTPSLANSPYTGTKSNSQYYVTGSSNGIAVTSNTNSDEGELKYTVTGTTATSAITGTLNKANGWTDTTANVTADGKGYVTVTITGSNSLKPKSSIVKATAVATGDDSDLQTIADAAGESGAKLAAGTNAISIAITPTSVSSASEKVYLDFTLASKPTDAVELTYQLAKADKTVVDTFTITFLNGYDKDGTAIDNTSTGTPVSYIYDKGLTEDLTLSLVSGKKLAAPKLDRIGEITHATPGQWKANDTIIVYFSEPVDMDVASVAMAVASKNSMTFTVDLHSSGAFATVKVGGTPDTGGCNVTYTKAQSKNGVAFSNTAQKLTLAADGTVKIEAQ